MCAAWAVCCAQLEMLFENFLANGGSRQHLVRACARTLTMAKAMTKDLDPPIECPLHDLTLNMFWQKDKAPKMKLKAADGHNCLFIVRHLLRVCFPPTTDRERTRLACIDHLCSCYHELRSWTDGGHSSCVLSDSWCRYLLLYVDLRRIAEEPLFWKLYPKHHLLAHLVDLPRDNPRNTWCYAMESAIGDASDLAARCNKAHVATALLERYRITMDW